MIGTRVGAHEIIAKLGEGGMGEVYRARDTKLGRDVAIKILPRAFTSDPERLARFEREARVLAFLNHPHIGAIYGVEDADGVRALVLELVEGETLADRISRGPIPVSEALRIARQIADALDTAHEKGIVHRDLKPANIKITPDGVVKVLDFGLAKAALSAEAIVDPAQSPTMTIGGTRNGVILGTAAYMSPEQARGQAVDKRSDIWAFGCVLYEMLTGRAPFEAQTTSDIIAKILTGEPNWAALPETTPPALVRLLKRCLERDARRRLRDLGDVDLALDTFESASRAPAPTRTLVWVMGIAVAALLAALAATQFRAAAPAETLPVRFEMRIPVRQLEAPSFAVSPDGRRVVLVGMGEDGVRRLWIRSLDTLETRAVSGTDGEVGLNTSMFWSPDGRFVGFYADGKVKKVDSLGGAPQVVCAVQSVLVGGSWNADDVIVMGSGGGGFLRCPAAGGDATPVTSTPNPGTVHFFPIFLPDGRHVLYLNISRTDPSETGIRIADLAKAPGEQATERLLGTGFSFAYVPADDGSGRILFAKDQALFAVSFDPARLVLTGEAVQIAAPIGSFRDAALLGAAPNLLVYRAGVPDLQMEWRSRAGSFLGKVGAPGPYLGLALSPEAERVVVLRENRLSRADQDLWLMDLIRDTTTRLTSDPVLESVPAWTPDGQMLMFAAAGLRATDLWEQPANGTVGRRLFAGAERPEIRVNSLLTSLSASADGRFLVFTTETAGRTMSDLWVLSRPDGTMAPLLQQDFAQSQGMIAPDGRWLAYVSDESGSNEVYVRPLSSIAGSAFPAPGTAIVVSHGGATAPRWRGDSKELFYQSPSGGVMAVPISPAEIGRPVELFRAAGMSPHWSVTRDGQRFLLALPTGEQPPMTVVLNWQSALKSH